jgi:capsule polysaccharide export protein KpsE/RkpR
MAEIINLRRVRKAKARTEAGKAAEANRMAFGRSKAEKQRSAAQMSLEAQRLEAHRLEPAPGEE